MSIRKLLLVLAILVIVGPVHAYADSVLLGQYTEIASGSGNSDTYLGPDLVDGVQLWIATQPEFAYVCAIGCNILPIENIVGQTFDFTALNTPGFDDFAGILADE